MTGCLNGFTSSASELESKGGGSKFEVAAESLRSVDEAVEGEEDEGV